MEKRLPLNDKDKYEEAVEGIVNLNFKDRTERNGGNKLGRKIRKSALEPFRFLREIPREYSTKRPSIVLTQECGQIGAGSFNHESQQRQELRDIRGINNCNFCLVG